VRAADIIEAAGEYVAAVRGDNARPGQRSIDHVNETWARLLALVDGARG